MALAQEQTGGDARLSLAFSNSNIAGSTGTMFEAATYCTIGP
jgi:hypothetical protein